MVVKVKKDGEFYKEKGEVIKVVSKDQVVIKIKLIDMEFKERELGKVLPSEGGHVMVIGINKKGKIERIDMDR